MVLFSALGHGLIGLALWLGGALADRWTPVPKPVMTARLVRLGPARKPDMLPTLAAPAQPAGPKKSAPTTPPKPPAPNPTTAAPASSAAGKTDSQAARAKTQSALERLRKISAGAPDGDEAGDADTAEAGERYYALVKQCTQDHWVLPQGISPALLTGRKGLVLLRIDANGTIINYRITQKSGLQAYDSAMEYAVSFCKKVPPPPPELRQGLRTAGIEINFEP
jgi:TonB family protein